MSGRSHNAIPSDYSSTGGVSQLRKRRGSGASSFSIPTSCYMKTIERPAKKMREEELPPNSGSSAPLGSDTQSQGEQATTTSGKANSRDSPPSSTRPRKRKFQLVPSRRGIPLILPETPILGYPITVEDYEQVQTDWVKTIFEDKTGEEYGLISHPRDGSLWFYFGLSPLRNPALGFSVDSEHRTAASSASLPAPSTNLLLGSLGELANSLGLPSFPGWGPFPSGKEQDQKHEKDLTSLAVTHDQDLQDESPEEPEGKRTCLDNDIEDNDIEDIDIGRN
ncbi:nuclear envelope pore membrane protein POM 121C-like [Manis pentadactyla]|uniref:nuclear envelope pore membrane protein POM 121C-like n=1 Tax=Manis pentadactyla TaxID=143292 RepID=UPI00255C648E|nr:nuclear envelope pore membrane protein POM 121C-like [Manis pentadactyla]